MGARQSSRKNTRPYCAEGTEGATQSSRGKPIQYRVERIEDTRLSFRENTEQYCVGRERRKKAWESLNQLRKPITENEVLNLPESDVDDNDRKVRRLWSYNCASGGHYVYMTGVSSGANGYLVAANGDAEGTTLPLTNITFEEDERPSDRNTPVYFLKFTSNSNSYYVEASTTEVKASANSNAREAATTFLCDPIFSEPFFVFQSVNVMDGDSKLYLSSDGAGNMKLKVWNAPVPPPPDTILEVDPALLFRMVRPLGQN